MEWTEIIRLASFILLVFGNISYIAYQGGYLKRRVESQGRKIDENDENIDKIKDSFTRKNGMTTYVSRREFEKMEQEMHDRIRRLEESNQRSNRKIMESLYSLEKQLAIINQHIRETKGTSPLNPNINCLNEDDDNLGH